MKMVKCLVTIVIVFLLGTFGFIQSGMFNVSAMSEANPLVKWVLHTTMERSVERQAQNIQVPDINNDELILAGLSDYVAMCAKCHGEPNKPAGILRQGLNPIPPDLESLAQSDSVAETFWVIENGIRMTGMPAFGKTHQANEIWPVVAFIHSAKDLGANEYNQLKIKAKDFGHHKPGGVSSDHTHTTEVTDQPEHSQPEETQPEASQPEGHADHHDHDHGHAH